MEQLSFRSSFYRDKYRALQFRRQVITHASEGIDYLKMFLKKDITHLYGSGEEENGPFSIKGYLIMLTDGEWCDSIFIYLIASCCGLRVTVIRSDSCAEVQCRHDKPLSEVDIGLMFNCSMSCGHYWGLMQFDGMYCTSKKVARASGYHLDDDKPTGKGDGDEVVVITRQRLVELGRRRFLMKC